MQIGRGRRIVARTSLVAILATWAAAVSSQDAGGSAFTITGEVRSTVELDDNGDLSANSPGSDLTFGTEIGVVIGYETPRSVLSFDFGGVLQAEDLAAGREENGFVRPRAGLSYQLEGADSLFEIDANYTEYDVANSFAFDSDGDLLNDVFLSSIGEVESYNVSLALSVGIEAPLGFDLALSRRERNYSNTVNPGLFDSTTDSFRATVRARPAETLTTRLFYDEERYEAEDIPQTERVTRTIGVGLDYEINPVLTFSGEIGWAEVEETTLVMGIPTTIGFEDYSIRSSLTQELPNGTAGISLDREVTTNITRTDIGVSRSMELPAGALSFGIGFSDGDPGASAITGFVDYSHEFPGAVLSLTAERTARIQSNNDQVVNNRLGLTYSRELTRTSDVILDVDYLRIDDIGSGTSSEGERMDLGLTYRQELTEDWDWSLGYVGRRTETATGTSATSNAIVFSVGRSFSLRP